MRRFEIVFKQTVSMVGSVVVEAETPAQAAQSAFAQRHNISFEIEWDTVSDPEIACDPEECELPEESTCAEVKAAYFADLAREEEN